MNESCSVCGNKAAVCVDEQHKGTYWLCGACVGERIEELIALRARIEAQERPVCIWVYDDFQDSWESTCDQVFCLADGSPSENGMSYCPFCGGSLIEAAAEWVFDEGAEP